MGDDAPAQQGDGGVPAWRLKGRRATRVQRQVKARQTIRAYKQREIQQKAFEDEEKQRAMEEAVMGGGEGVIGSAGPSR